MYSFFKLNAEKASINFHGRNPLYACAARELTDNGKSHKLVMMCREAFLALYPSFLQVLAGKAFIGGMVACMVARRCRIVRRARVLTPSHWAPMPADQPTGALRIYDVTGVLLAHCIMASLAEHACIKLQATDSSAWLFTGIDYI